MKNLIKHLFMLCLIGMISMGANAEIKSGSCGENVEWTFDTETGHLSLEGTGPTYNYTATSYNPSPLKGIGRITTMSVGEGITTIGRALLWYNNYISSIYLPSTLENISVDNAFYYLLYINSKAQKAPDIYMSDCRSNYGTLVIPDGADYSSWFGTGTNLLDENTWNKSQTSEYFMKANEGLSSGKLETFKEKIIGTKYDNGVFTYYFDQPITSIPSELFLDCPYLTNVNLPSTILSIGDKAFYNCTGLTSITIPESVTSIGSAAFWNCSSLTSVTIPESVTSIEESAFRYCSGLTSVTIPNSVTSIGSSAFYECSGLTSVEIPNSVTSIGNYAFYNCSGLTSVTIGNSVTSIGYYAFYNCSGLTSVTIGNSVTSIGDYAFCNCSGLTSVTIPNSVTSIGERAFYDCSSLTSVTIPESVTSIGESAFYGCTSLPEENNLRYADTYLVEAVDKTLSTYNIKESTKWIGNSAFSGCSGLTSVTIPNSVTSIEDYAFSGCSGLKNIIAEGISAPNIGWNCFYGVENCSLHVPSGSKESYESNFGNFKSGSGNKIETYSSYSKNSDGEYNFETWSSSSDVTLREGIEKVYVPVEATVNKLEYKRTFNNTDWQALYVPFELDVENDLADFSVYEISTSSADAINVTLMTEGTTSANTPYLIKAKATGEQAIPVSSKKVEVTVENTNSELSNFEIVGTYAKLKYGDISGDWYALKGGKFMKAGEGAYLNPYRFYLKRKASSSKESIEINFNEPTGITLYENDNDNDNENLYNLNGMRVDSNYKGIVIINGKKYLKK